MSALVVSSSVVTPVPPIVPPDQYNESDTSTVPVPPKVPLIRERPAVTLVLAALKLAAAVLSMVVVPETK